MIQLLKLSFVSVSLEQNVFLLYSNTFLSLLSPKHISVYAFVDILHHHLTREKSLKIPKGQSESVNRRRTDNTMAKRKRTNNDLQNIHIKLKIK